MPSLSVIDLAMFALETAQRPFNIGPLVVLRPPAKLRGNFADKLAACTVDAFKQLEQAKRRKP